MMLRMRVVLVEREGSERHTAGETSSSFLALGATRACASSIMIFFAREKSAGSRFLIFLRNVGSSLRSFPFGRRQIAQLFNGISDIGWVRESCEHVSCERFSGNLGCDEVVGEG